MRDQASPGSSGRKSLVLAPQTGQNQSLGMSSNRVPGGIPPSGSPIAGSYMNPQLSQIQRVASLVSVVMS
jgi:hypothetical protein